MPIKRARLIYGATYMAESINMDLFWLVRMPLGDPHFFVEFELICLNPNDTYNLTSSSWLSNALGGFCLPLNLVFFEHFHSC